MVKLNDAVTLLSGSFSNESGGEINKSIHCFECSQQVERLVGTQTTASLTQGVLNHTHTHTHTHAKQGRRQLTIIDSPNNRMKTL